MPVTAPGDVYVSIGATFPLALAANSYTTPLPEVVESATKMSPFPLTFTSVGALSLVAGPEILRIGAESIVPLVCGAKIRIAGWIPACGLP